MAIWQDLVDAHGRAARYASVGRSGATLRGHLWPDPQPLHRDVLAHCAALITTPFLTGYWTILPTDR
jgi:hypothetical protein